MRNSAPIVRTCYYFADDMHNRESRKRFIFAIYTFSMKR